MRFLVDTHYWIWYLTEDPRLKGRVKEAMLHRPSEVFLSPMSVYETSLLASRQVIDLGNRPLHQIRTELESSDFIAVPITMEIVLLSRELPFTHEDPADRIIAATAKAHDLPLATMDQRLIGLPWLKTIQ